MQPEEVVAAKEAEKAVLKELDGELTKEMLSDSPRHDKLAAIIDVEDAIKRHAAEEEVANGKQ